MKKKENKFRKVPFDLKEAEEFTMKRQIATENSGFKAGIDKKILSRVGKEQGGKAFAKLWKEKPEYMEEILKKARPLGGKVQGRRNVESGHWASLKTPEHQSKAGKAGAKANKDSGYYQSEEHRESSAIGGKNSWSKQSLEEVAARKAAMAERTKKSLENGTHVSQQIRTCTKCGFESIRSNITRYHDDNCTVYLIKDKLPSMLPDEKFKMRAIDAPIAQLAKELNVSPGYVLSWAKKLEIIELVEHRIWKKKKK